MGIVHRVSGPQMAERSARPPTRTAPASRHLWTNLVIREYETLTISFISSCFTHVGHLLLCRRKLPFIRKWYQPYLREQRPQEDAAGGDRPSSRRRYFKYSRRPRHF